MFATQISIARANFYDICYESIPEKHSRTSLYKMGLITEKVKIKKWLKNTRKELM